MALVFPNSPTLNQRVTTGGREFEWNGSAWVLVGSGVPGVSAIYSTTDPSLTTSLAVGTMWVDSDEVYTGFNPNDFILRSEASNDQIVLASQIFG